MAVKDNIDAARADDEAAGKARLAASKKALERLKEAKLAKQFDALQDCKELEPEHRCALREHIEAQVEGSGAPATFQISGGVATRFEVWRSRLPYRIVPIAVNSFVGVAIAVAFAVAYARTPVDLVVSRYDRDVECNWTLNGGVLAGVLSSRHPYARVSLAREQSVIRDWIPGVGYAEARIPNDALMSAPAGAKVSQQ